MFIELSGSEKTVAHGLAAADSIVGNYNGSVFMGKEGAAALITALGGLSWGLGYLGQPHLVIRYMAIRSSKDVPVSRNIAIACAILGIAVAFLVGIVALIYFAPVHF